jgi:putative polymerase
MERKIFWGWFISAGVVIVMSDSRFGANFCAFGLLLALLPAAVRTGAVALLPVGALLSLLLLPTPLSAHYGIDNGFIGRIILSGRILERFDALNWLGVQAPDFITSDSGYAYALAGFGIAGLAFFWTMLLATKGRDDRFYLLRDLAGAYFATLLCISNSPFTIKTGALLWFLVGVLSRAVKRDRRGNRGSMHLARRPSH